MSHRKMNTAPFYPILNMLLLSIVFNLLITPNPLCAQSNSIEISYYSSSTTMKINHSSLNTTEDRVSGEGYGISIATVGRLSKDKIFVRTETGIFSSHHTIYGSFFNNLEQRDVSMTGHWNSNTLFFSINPEFRWHIENFSFFVNAGPILSVDIQLDQSELEIIDRLANFTNERSSAGFNGQLGATYSIKSFILGMKFLYANFGKKKMVNRYYPTYRLSTISFALVCGIAL